MLFSHMNDAHCTLIRFDLPILQYVILIMARSCFARIVNRDHSSSFLKGTQQKMREKQRPNRAHSQILSWHGVKWNTIKLI